MTKAQSKSARLKAPRGGQTASSHSACRRPSRSGGLDSPREPRRASSATRQGVTLHELMRARLLLRAGLVEAAPLRDDSAHLPYRSA